MTDCKHQFPKYLLKDEKVTVDDYTDAFNFIFDSLDNYDTHAIDSFLSQFDPNLHSAEFAAGVLRCASSNRPFLQNWFNVRDQVQEALIKDGKDPNDALYGMTNNSIVYEN